MSKWISKQQILDLSKGKTFKNEGEFRDYISPLLAKLFEIKDEQIEKEAVTTSFNYELSNRADIIIRSDNDKFKKALVVFLCIKQKRVGKGGKK